MSEPSPKSQPASDGVTPPPPMPKAPPALRTKRPSNGIYDWLIPVILIFLALVLASIIIASLGAMLGLWPIH